MPAAFIIRAMIVLMMEAASTSETSVFFYQTTRRNNAEDSNIHTCRRENMNSHLGIFPISVVIGSVVLPTERGFCVIFGFVNYLVMSHSM
jgi:hypothetical protein